MKNDALNSALIIVLCVVFYVVYFGLFVVNSKIAIKKRRSVFWVLIGSLFFTPILPLLYLLFVPEKPIQKMICPNCGQKGEPTKFVKGNFVTEIILWFIMVLPGLIYTIWRSMTVQMVCPSCKQPGMIPETSPRGQELLKKYSS